MLARIARFLPALALILGAGIYLLRMIYTPDTPLPAAQSVGLSKRYGYALKRSLDVAIAAMALVVFAPVLLVVALAIRVTMGGPVLFRQQRPGLHGKPFTMYKFRTMTDTRDADGHLLPDADRLTALGRFLRSTSVDELPELFNVLKGDMSVVGPRPLLLKYMPYYSKVEQQRHYVRPGITGWAQINGRNDVHWDERLASDVWYVNHCSMQIDLWIIAKTFLSIVTREGVVIDPRSTMLDLDVERRKT